MRLVLKQLKTQVVKNNNRKKKKSFTNDTSYAGPYFSISGTAKLC